MSEENNDSTATSNTEAGEEQSNNDQGTEENSEQSDSSGQEEVAVFEAVIPEGAEIDKESLASYQEMIGQNKISPEHAQAVLDYLFDSQKKSAASQKSLTESSIKDSQKLIKADPDVGGTNYDKVIKSVDQLALRFGGEDFKKQINEHGFKNDLPFLRFINNIQSVLTEDKILNTSQSETGKRKDMSYKQVSEKMFPKDTIN